MRAEREEAVRNAGDEFFIWLNCLFGDSHPNSNFNANYNLIAANGNIMSYTQYCRMELAIM